MQRFYSDVLSFLTAFFENLLLGGQNDLSSEKMYLDLDLDFS